MLAFSFLVGHEHEDSVFEQVGGTREFEVRFVKWNTDVRTQVADKDARTAVVVWPECIIAFNINDFVGHGVIVDGWLVSRAVYFVFSSALASLLGAKRAWFVEVVIFALVSENHGRILSVSTIDRDRTSSFPFSPRGWSRAAGYRNL